MKGNEDEHDGGNEVKEKVQWLRNNLKLFYLWELIQSTFLFFTETIEKRKQQATAATTTRTTTETRPEGIIQKAS